MSYLPPGSPVSVVVTCATNSAAHALLMELGYTHQRALSLASAAEACARFGDMSAIVGELMRRRSAEGIVMNPMERSLFSVAFKNRLTSHRSTLKMLGYVAEHEKEDLQLTAVQDYTHVQETHVLTLAEELIELVSHHQLPVCEEALSAALSAAAPPPPSNTAAAGASSSDSPASASAAAAALVLVAGEAASSASTVEASSVDATSPTAEVSSGSSTATAATAAVVETSGSSPVSNSASSAIPEAASSNNSGEHPPPSAEVAIVATPSSSKPLSIAELVEASIFWYKLTADYCRYVAECLNDALIVSKHSDMALSYYSKARQYATLHLHPAHPTTLGVSLNMSVYLFEIRRCEVEAFEIANAVVEEAVEALAADDAARGENASKGSTASASSSGASASSGQAVAASNSVTGVAAPVPRKVLSRDERKESEAVIALLRENARVWSTILNM